MKTVYAIFKYNQTDRTSEFGGLFETKELAIEQLKVWANEIKTGKWYLAEFIKWNDETDEEVTSMEFVRYKLDPGQCPTFWTYCVEECQVKSEI